MRIVRYILFAMATVMLFVQCDKGEPVPSLEEENVIPPGEEEAPSPDPNPSPYPDASEWAHWEKDRVFYSRNKWSEVVVGDIPLIITAPHGGFLEPRELLDRDCPDASVANDANTQPLTREIREYIKNTYGKSPYIVVNHLHRKKIDQNRDLREAVCVEAELTTAAWHDFHNYIDTALWRAVTEHGYALYIDIHGHGHSIPRLEIGYRLSATDLKTLHDNPVLAGLTLMEKSSIRDVFLLFDKPRSDFHSFIMGDKAFGTLMANEGIRSVPGKQEPFLNPGELYFNGGYNTDRYTGNDYPGVYGFQIEAHRSVRDNRAEFVKKLSGVLLAYMELTKP